MSSSVTPLVVAIAGVVGTLASAVTTQVLSMHSRASELRAQDRQRHDDRERELRRASFLDRRQSYIGLHTAAWNFRLALKSSLFEDRDDVATALEEARKNFVTGYRSAQIIAPDAVVSAAVPVYDVLTEAYGRIKPVMATGDRDVLQGFLNSQVGDAIRQLTQAMRSDLGISASPEGLLEERPMATAAPLRDGPHEVHELNPGQVSTVRALRRFSC